MVGNCARFRKASLLFNHSGGKKQNLSPGYVPEWSGVVQFDAVIGTLTGWAVFTPSAPRSFGDSNGFRTFISTQKTFYRAYYTVYGSLDLLLVHSEMQ